MRTRLPEQARGIVANPQMAVHCPDALAVAWSDLLAARGRKMRRHRLGPPAHHIERDNLPPALALQLDRVRDKVAAIEACKGITRPARPMPGGAA